MSRDLRQELAADDGERPISWNPQPGDMVVGKLIRVDRGHSEFGEYDVAVIQEESPKRLVAVWLTTTVLIAEWAREKPVPGDEVGIKRLPDDERKKYKRFKLLVKRPTPPPPADPV